MCYVMIGKEAELHYHIWAAKKMVSYLHTLPKEIYHKRVQSVFPSIERTLFHLYEVDALWFSRLQQQPYLIELESFHSVEECLSHFEKLHREMLEWRLSIDDIKKKISYENSLGEAFENTAEEILYHIVNHGTYHRGNITAILWQLGEKGVSTDYIYYLRERETEHS